MNTDAMSYKLWVVAMVTGYADWADILTTLFNTHLSDTSMTSLGATRGNKEQHEWDMQFE